MPEHDDAGRPRRRRAETAPVDDGVHLDPAALRAQDDVLAELEVAGVAVAVYRAGATLPVRLSPRPFLHPVRTVSGTAVTDAGPQDHRWHLGASVAVQGVGGANVWGGRTYRRGRGYVWLDDHGRVTHEGWRLRSADHLVEDLRWRAADGAELLAEQRELRASASADVPRAWVLELAVELRSTSRDPLALTSPATEGRAGAGYGGLFWRLPRSARPPRVRTSRAVGERAVHGSLAPWLAWSGDAGDDASPFTLVLAGVDDATRTDPWFVRAEEYPGVGASLAAVEPLRLLPGEVVRRRWRVLVADGLPADDEVERWGDAVGR